MRGVAAMAGGSRGTACMHTAMDPAAASPPPPPRPVLPAPVGSSAKMNGKKDDEEDDGHTVQYTTLQVDGGGGGPWRGGRAGDGVRRRGMRPGHGARWAVCHQHYCGRPPCEVARVQRVRAACLHIGMMALDGWHFGIILALDGED